MVLFVDALVEDGMVQQSVVWGENDKGDLVGKKKNIFITFCFQSPGLPTLVH